MMKLRNLMVLLSALLFLMRTEADVKNQDAADFIIGVKADKKDSVYRTAEKIKFSVILLKDGKAVPGKKLSYLIERDGSETLKGEIVSAEKPVLMETFLEKPGFALCTVSFTDNGREFKSFAGAGAMPYEIKPVSACPDDFDKFWSEKKVELNKIPVSFKKEKVETPPEFKGKLECFEVKADCGEFGQVSGYLVMPVNAAEASLPAIVLYQSAGVLSVNLKYICERSGGNKIAFGVNAHGIDNGRPEEYYKNISREKLEGYPYFNMDDRNKIYFVGMFLRAYRALQIVKSLPEWDGRTLIAFGGSQGGGQALAATALDPDVTFCVARISALCDNHGIFEKRKSGWPQFIKKAKKTEADKVADAVRYVDAVNFASRIKAGVVMTVGFIDRTCSPSSCFAAYNSIPAGMKTIICTPDAGHGSVPADVEKEIDGKINGHITRK